MKNLIFSCAVACAISLACINKAHAQEKNHFGIKAGIDLMTLGSASDNGFSLNYNYRPGFQGGFYADLSLSKQVSFMPQVLYTQKGGNISTSFTIGSTTAKFNGYTQLNYVDVPLLFAFKPQSNLNLYVGPQIAFFASQRSEVTGTANGSSTTSSSTSSDGLRKVIFGGNIGIGYNITSKAGIDLNYVFDLQHAGDQNDTGEKNSGFALSLRYAF